jgi:hypothetical protein
MTPATAAEATICAIRSPVRFFDSISLISKMVAPMIAGTAINRLKLTAQVFEKPSARAVEMVRPLRLTPGSGANIWATPMSKTSSQEVSSGPFSPPLRRTLTNRTAAVIKKPIPA